MSADIFILLLYLFFLERWEWTLALCISLLSYSNNRESCQEDRGVITEERTFYRALISNQNGETTNRLSSGCFCDIYGFQSMQRSENWCFYLLYLPQITLIKILHAFSCSGSQIFRWSTECGLACFITNHACFISHLLSKWCFCVSGKKRIFFCQPLVFIHFCTIWDNCWVLRHQYRMDTTGWITNWKNWTTALGPQTTIDTHSPKFTAWQFGNAINCKSVGLTGRIN